MPSKRFKKTKNKIDKEKLYTVEEAVNLIKELANAKFDESIELHARVGIDPKQGDQQVRATVTLPHGTGKEIRVAAFVDSANEAAAKKAGADIVGTEETIEKLNKTGEINFDVAVATPAMMPKLAKAAKILGPRGLMPNPKTDTVGDNVEKMVQDQKTGKVAFKNDNTSNIHTIVGKASFETQKLQENVQVMINALKKAKPHSSKGIYLKSLFLTSTMGPSIKLDPNA